MTPRQPNILPAHTYPVDEWQIVEESFSTALMGQTETVFALANGYLGIRGTLDEGRPGYEHGTFVNGFHETWPIVHAEEAYGFAKTGQTMVNVPDGTVLRLYVDDEPLHVPEAHLHSFRRTLDFRTGTLDRDIVWELPSNKRVRVRSRRMVSFTHRHLALVTYEVTLLNSAAPIVISSQLLNRERTPPDEPGDVFDPRKGTVLDHKVLVPTDRRTEGERLMLGYEARDSGMTLGCGAEHVMATDNPWSARPESGDHFAKVVYTIEAQPDEPIRLSKYLSYHTSKVVPARELVDRVSRTLDRARSQGSGVLLSGQRDFLTSFWERSDVQIDGDPATQQAVRWSLFQLLQAGGRAEGAGIPAKGLTGQAYEGHYFWDTEIYVLPFFTYTAPRIARNLLRLRHTMLNQARRRAKEVSQRGALFPWRTINGEEASAYYEAGTAQYHINADIAYALEKYLHVTGDVDALADFGAEILVETARLWVDLGFFNGDGNEFHIHGVTGPDEYTTLVNDNAYTNMMARHCLSASARLLDKLQALRPDTYDRLAEELDLRDDEVESWRRAARGMHIPYDTERGIHPQDANFLDKKVWDFENTPPERYPLLLHFHPLVIYRYQVLKQADVVLAMLLLSDEFTADEKRSNFDYYDPLTTGDSSLSASVQCIIAAELGEMRRAMDYFRHALYMDLGDVTGNASDGVHVASAGGLWMTLVMGFGGMRDNHVLRFDPRLPPHWTRLAFKLGIRGSWLDVELTQESASFRLTEGEQLELVVAGEALKLSAGEPATVELPPAS